MGEFAVRQAISQDIPDLIALDHDYSTDHVWQMSFSSAPNELGMVFREVRLPRPMRVTYPREARRLADDWGRRACVLLAEGQGLRLGYLAMLEGPAQDSGWISDLVVGSPHRRQGIGARLLNAARRWSMDRSLKHLFLEMQSKNYPAICLAKKMGFSFAGFSDCYYPDQDIALFFTLDLS